MTARAIEFFTPGIPHVYYVGALAGPNDLELLARTGIGRDINRHYYTPEEVDAALDRPVVQALLALCRFRTNFDVFDGASDFTADDDHRLRFAYRAGQGVTARSAELHVEPGTGAATLEWQVDGNIHRTDDLLNHPPTVYGPG